MSVDNLAMPWLQSYPADIVKEIDLNRFASLCDVIENSYQNYSNNVALSNMGKSLTYAHIAKYSHDFAAFLQNTLQLKKGDRIAIMLPNIMQYIVVLHAAICAGLVIVNVNPQYTPRELKHQLQDCDAKAIVVIDMRASVLEQVIQETNIQHVIVTRLGDLLGFPRGVLINFAVKYVKHLIPSWHIPGAISFRDALAKGAAQTFQKVAMAADDLAFLQYTGGTTGVAKGAMLTHRNIIANMLQCQAWFGEHVYKSVRLAIVPLPLYHIFSLTINAFTVMALGGRMELITDPRNIKNLIKIMRKLPFTMISAVNTLYNALLHNENFRQIDFSNLSLSVAGGMATHDSVAAAWYQTTGNAILDGYGLTETSPVVAVNPYTTKKFNGSVGLPLPSTIVDIRDDLGKSLSIGEIGEVYVKGPQVMKGYWRQPKETAEVLSSDGWLRTGDIGRFDEQGFLYLVDRKKDMILVSGFNVYPNEVENVVAAHPGVLECAVIGVPDEESGERVKLFVVPKDSNLTLQALQAYCHENLTGYKRPREIEFSQQLPKNTVGKILRRGLREQNQRS